MKVTIVEHRVYARRPGETRQRMMAPYAADRWQFALKLQRYLISKGFDQVEIRDEHIEIRSSGSV